MSGLKEIGVVDAHHHVWRQKDLPWLLGPSQPRIFGDYDAIKRDYLIDEYRADVAGLGVVKSVYVQANWAPNWFADEAAWVQSVADASRWPHAIVAFADLTQTDATPALEKLKAYPLMRGVRQQLHWHQNPQYRFAPRPDLVADPTLVKNVARLADYGWVFELQVFASQMADAEKLARACPETTFVLQHAGMLEDLSDANIALWRAGLKRLADAPNVVCKLSGFGTFMHRNDPEHIAFVAGEALAALGADRCLFGSNFPIEKIWTDYASLLGAFDAATANLAEEDRRKIFAETATRVYRL